MGEIPLDVLHVRPLIPPPGLRRDMGTPTGPRLDTQIPPPSSEKQQYHQRLRQWEQEMARAGYKLPADLRQEPQMPTANDPDPLAWQKYELALAEWEEAQAIAVVEQRERAKMQAREDARLERRRKFWRAWRWPLVGAVVLPLLIWAVIYLR